MKYRKKPIVIEAWQWLFSPAQQVAPAWMDDAVMDGTASFWPDGYGEHPHPQILIKTLEGVMIAIPGDYIIRGIKGELYPVKEEIFRDTYEAVDDAAC